MLNSVSAIDPAWAWSAFEGADDQRWDRRTAAHLYRRACFGATSAELDEAISGTAEEAVDRLLAQSSDPRVYDDEMRPLSRLAEAAGEPEGLAAWWLYRMLHSPAQLREKITLFWHGHFATSNAKVQSSPLMLRQNRLLRDLAMGPFHEMVAAISRDPAMLIYLDSKTNRKIHPNENYAREVMELFCLGVGNYTEQDVQEAARCFTGWEVRDNKFRFNRYQHDDGEKRLLGRQGEFGGDDAIGVILDQPAAARFIAAKLYRFYIADEPAPPDELLEPLAELLRVSDFRIEVALQRVLSSNLFFSEMAVGRKIRSPVEMAIGMLRSLEATFATTELARMLQPLGQLPFYPPNVKGWDGGRVWINSTTLLGRANLIQRILTDGDSRFAQGSLADFGRSHSLEDPKACVDWLSQLLLAAPLSPQLRSELIKLAEARRSDLSEQLISVIHVMSTMPEFQLA